MKKSPTRSRTREGQILDFDKLTMMVETDGSRCAPRTRWRSPRASCRTRAVFISFEEPKKPVDEAQRHPELAFNAALLKKVDELELGVRSASCLKNDNIVYIGDLIQKTEAEMPHAERRAQVSERVKEVLASMGLHLGMEVPNWPPDNIEELAKRFEDQY